MTSPEPHPAASDSLQTTLLYRLRTGDQESWRRLDHLYGPVVLGWCRSAGLPPEDAADVQQEVYRAVLRHLADCRRERPGDSFRGWLYTITLNKIRDHWRRQNRQVAAAGGTAAVRAGEIGDSTCMSIVYNHDKIAKCAATQRVG